MVRFSNAQVAEAIQPFWAALQRGEFIADAAVQAGRYRKRSQVPGSGVEGSLISSVLRSRALGREEFDLLFLGDGWLFLGSWGQKSAH